MDQDLCEHIVDCITANQEKFYRLAYSYARNRDDALDIVQRAVCKALSHCEGLRNRNAVKTWFYRILVNESLQLVSRRSREIPAEDGAAGMGISPTMSRNLRRGRISTNRSTGWT